MVVEIGAGEGVLHQIGETHRDLRWPNGDDGVRRWIAAVEEGRGGGLLGAEDEGEENGEEHDGVGGSGRLVVGY